MHNICLPVDDPFWQTHAPPNGWNCRCTLQSLSAGDLRRLIAGGENMVLTAPPITTRRFVNNRTGEIRQVPDGVDPGWDYNPGKAGHDETVRRLQQAADAGQMFPPLTVVQPKPPTPAERDVLAALLTRDQAAWAAGLSDQEKAALGYYKLSGYKEINSVLRKGRQAVVDAIVDAELPMPSDADIDVILEDAKKRAALLAGAIGRARLLRDITVYRRVGDPIMSKLKLLGEIEERAFASATLWLPVTKSKGFKGSTVELRLRSGMKAAYVHAIPKVQLSEYEVLIAPDVRWRVIGRANRRWILEAVR
jgi:hypothetical protein